MINENRTNYDEKTLKIFCLLYNIVSKSDKPLNINNINNIDKQNKNDNTKVRAV